MNTIQLIGRLTRDPELRSTGDGDCVCALRLAVDRMGRGGAVGYIDVSVWGKAGQACAAHLTKGRLVAFAGRLEYREWQVDDGSRRAMLSAVGAVEFLPGGRSDGSRDAVEPALAA